MSPTELSMEIYTEKQGGNMIFKKNNMGKDFPS